MKRLLRHPLAQAGLARLVGYYLWLALRTTRWTIEGEEHLLPHVAGESAIVAFWHEQVALTPIVPALSHRLPGAVPSRIYALVSRHRDGQLIGTVLELFGVRLVHGSSSRGGTAALQRLARVLTQGAHVGTHAGWSTWATAGCRPRRGAARRIVRRSGVALRRPDNAAEDLADLGSHDLSPTLRTRCDRLPAACSCGPS